MEDDMDIQPPRQQDNETDREKEKKQFTRTPPTAAKSKSPRRSSVPLYEDLQAVPEPGKTAAETALIYANYLQHMPGFPWQSEAGDMNPTPCFAAPYITGGNPEALTESQLITGFFLNIPRSPKLWAGDQLKLRWGHNTFYTTIGKSVGRDGPRLVQYMNNETLADYDNGKVDIRYEVVRRTKLVGISETLTLNLPRLSKRRSKASLRSRLPRRRRT